MATLGSGAGVGQRGRFWLQGTSGEEAVAGTLFLRPGAHPRLELDAALVLLMRETSRRPLPDGGEVRTSSPVPEEELASQSLTIHGTLDKNGEDVTLPSAFTVGWTMGPGPTSHQMEALYALCGAHVNGADAQFTSARIRLRHLDAWANLPGFKIVPGTVDGGWALTFEPPQVPSATMPSGARITLEQVPEIGTPTVQGGQVKRHLMLDFLGMPPTTYRDIDRTIVKPVMNLLTLAVGMECPPVEILLDEGSGIQWLTVHHAGMKAPAEDVVPQNKILALMAVVGLEEIAAWLKLTARLGPLPSIVARAASAQDDPVEVQLLELTSAAEGLHRLLRPKERRMTKQQAREARAKALEAVDDLDEDVRKAVEDSLSHVADQTYSRRLLDLAEQVKEAVPGVTGNVEEWKKRVAGARNNLAHKLDDGFLGDDIDAQEAIVLSLSLRWLLAGFLLLQTGISSTVLGNRLQGHRPYQLFLSQARAWLPEVYHSSGEHPADEVTGTSLQGSGSPDT
jgi:hypothetical protein